MILNNHNKKRSQLQHLWVMKIYTTKEMAQHTIGSTQGWKQFLQRRKKREERTNLRRMLMIKWESQRGRKIFLRKEKIHVMKEFKQMISQMSKSPPIRDQGVDHSMIDIVMIMKESKQEGGQGVGGVDL